MNDVLELINEVRQTGATLRAEPPDLVISPPGRVPQALKERLKERKREVLAVLARTSPNLDGWRDLPLSEVERRHVAIKIRSDEYGTLWLVSTEAERGLADSGHPAYTVQEARRMIGLPEPLVRQIHALKKTFGGTLGAIQPW